MDDIKGTLFKITKGVGKSSSNLLKSAKLSMNLASEEDNLKKIYIDIGKKVHEIYLYGGSLGKVFDDKYREIVESEARINGLREKINAVKGAQVCPKCGKTIDRAAEFCPKCGFRIQEGADGGAVDAARTGKPLAGSDAPRSEIDISARPLEARPVAEPRTESGYAGTLPAAETRPAAWASGAGAYTSEPAASGRAEPAQARPIERPAPAETPAPVVRCAACGAEAEPGAKFCLSCGRILR
ncbi:MAG: zinc-ribbon domain-containing protein [Defluviitaleaceae bacterium]|nr:zinc-ribbon domain-containing protein [Defluviitaleaceae bacterium]